MRQHAILRLPSLPKLPVAWLGATTLLASLLLAALPDARADVIRVRFESERPGAQASSATFSQLGVERFDTVCTASGQP